MLIQSLKIFCDLIDSQSFSRAAVLNSVTQSAVSQQIKSIERRQGRALLERKKRQISLTLEGEVFYRSARDIVRRYEEMQNRIEALYGVVSGTVRLSAIYSVGMLEIATYLKTYLKAHPRVNLRLAYNQAQKIYDEVASGEIDLGIVAYPRPQRNVEIIPFAEDRMVVACHPSNPLAKQESVAPKTLGRYPMILFVQETPTRQALDRYFKQCGVRPNIAMELDHIDTIKDAVEIDIGISIVPAPAVEREQAEGALSVLPLEGKPLVRPLGILHRQGRSFSVATRKLLEVLKGETDPQADAPPEETPAETT